MTKFGTLTLKEKDEIETKFDKALGTIQCFFDPTFKEILLEEVLLPKMSGRHSRITWKGNIYGKGGNKLCSLQTL